jgi:hypothetical protein
MPRARADCFFPACSTLVTGTRPPPRLALLAAASPSLPAASGDREAMGLGFLSLASGAAAWWLTGAWAPWLVLVSLACGWGVGQSRGSRRPAPRRGPTGIAAPPDPDALVAPRAANSTVFDDGVSRGLALRDRALVFRPGGAGSAVPVLSVDEPFGITLFANHSGSRIVAVLSSRGASLLVAAAPSAQVAESTPHTAAGADAHWVALLERASMVALDEAALDAIGPDGMSLVLPAAELLRLLTALVRSEPAAFDRLVTSDSSGELLWADDADLRVGTRRFDLTKPLEWRPLVFQEAVGAGTAFFQGTWVRQAHHEVVFVSPLPLGSPLIDPTVSGFPASLARDLQWMQAPFESPPPRDKRVAIDRLLMVPLRSKLALAAAA